MFVESIVFGNDIIFSSQAWNTKSGYTHHLGGPVGQALAMAVARDMLFVVVEVSPIIIILF